LRRYAALSVQPASRLLSITCEVHFPVRSPSFSQSQKFNGYLTKTSHLKIAHSIFWQRHARSFRNSAFTEGKFECEHKKSSDWQFDIG